MTRLNNILAKANELASASSIDSASDEDFIARVEAICLVRHIGYMLLLDEAPVLRKMRRLYPQFSLRIDSKEDCRMAIPVVRSFRRFIYGYSPTGAPMGPEAWRENLSRYESRMGVSGMGMTNSEVSAARDGGTSTDYGCSSGKSRRLKVEHLRTLADNEIERLRNVADERLLRNQLRGINDGIIPDILPLRITATMSVSTLRALDTIFSLRSRLAYVSRDSNEPVYANLQCLRAVQISGALKTKYGKSRSLNERIGILSFVERLEQEQSCGHSGFALGEAERLLARYGEGMTAFQRLSLAWISDKDTRVCEDTVRELLPQAETVFDITALTSVMEFCPEHLRRDIVARFMEIFKMAVADGDVEGVGTMLTTAAAWNAEPWVPWVLKEMDRETGGLPLSLAERRVGTIAAEIHSRIDNKP